MRVDELPKPDSLQYPVNVTVRVSLETKEKLDKLRAIGKSPTKVLRQIIENGLEAIEFE